MSFRPELLLLLAACSAFGACLYAVYRIAPSHPEGAHQFTHHARSRRSARAKLLTATLLCAAASACAPTYHRVQAYRFDPAEADQLEEGARDACAESQGEAPAPKRRFVTDGCTLWPDGWWTGRSWAACCVDHDAAYWCGGSDAERSEADRELRTCVSEAYSGWMGGVMWLGTRAMGPSWMPAHWRWGYGHDYPSSGE